MTIWIGYTAVGDFYIQTLIGLVMIFVPFFLGYIFGKAKAGDKLKWPNHS
ncbi:MAG: hypothetical protein MUC81_06285 [Bacteroidia bacterium]|jgi:hypothetical protein|nr:hypothetical protein [Bacteroidia bacterium]